MSDPDVSFYHYVMAPAGRIGFGNNFETQGTVLNLTDVSGIERFRCEFETFAEAKEFSKTLMKMPTMPGRDPFLPEPEEKAKISRVDEERLRSDPFYGTFA